MEYATPFLVPEPGIDVGLGSAFRPTPGRFEVSVSQAQGPLPGSPDFQFDPYHPDFERDPYPTWTLLREHAPVFWWAESNAWVLTRHADVTDVMRDEEHFTTDRRLWDGYEPPPEALQDLPFVRMMSANLFAYEGAEHTRLRRLASVALTRRAVRDLIPLMERLIEDLLAPILHRGEVELIEEIASIYPVTVVSRLLGVPEKSDREREFKHFSDGLVAAASPVVADEYKLRAFNLGNQFISQVEELMEEKRRAPANDLMTDMLQAESEGDRFTPDEITSMIMAILVAGSETTANSMALGLVDLLRHPEQYALFRDRPELRSNAVAEMVRYQMPGRFLTRFVREPLSFRGENFQTGQLILCAVPAAQRDPAYIEDPDRFDITRTPVDSSAFGIGRHFCLGAQLARLELEVSLGSIVETLPDLALSIDPSELEFRHNPTVRGPDKLPLRFTPQA